MSDDKFKVFEDNDGIVIYDAGDDYDPGEGKILDEDDELETDYLLRETARQEAQQAKEQRTQRWVSVGVIAAVVTFITGVCYFNFRNII